MIRRSAVWATGDWRDGEIPGNHMLMRLVAAAFDRFAPIVLKKSVLLGI